jgi:hypothetical protein
MAQVGLAQTAAVCRGRGESVKPDPLLPFLDRFAYGRSAGDVVG